MNNFITIIPTFLRQPREFFQSIGRGEGIGSKARALALSSILFLASYGFVTGLSHSLMQALSSAVKMPVLFIMAKDAGKKSRPEIHNVAARQTENVAH